MSVEYLQAPRFFGREAESNALKTHLQASPTTILVVLGPRSSGKTALLKAVLSDSVAAGGFPPSHLDARSMQLTDAGVLVRGLQEEGGTAAQRLSKVIR